MDLDELRTVQSKERRKDSLQRLRDSFYEDVADYVRGRKAERDRRAEAVENPFSDSEVRRLSDEIETAEEVAEALYERRVGKVVKLASFAAAEMPVDEEGLTDHERDLFDDLVARIGENKSRVLDVLSGENAGQRASADVDGDGITDADAGDGAPAGAADREAPTDAAADDGIDDGGVLADAMGGERADADVDPETAGAPGPERSAGDDPPTPAAVDEEAGDAPDGTGTGTDDAEADASAGDGSDADAEEADARTTVRITRDVGAIFGVDEREYDLADEDVVRLPAANAEPLIERGAAERLD